jgi:hypothetical protein
MTATIRRLLIAFLVLLAVGLVAARFITHNAPSGQLPLATLDATSLLALQADFNRSAGDTRIILLLSPT